MRDEKRTGIYSHIESAKGGSVILYPTDSPATGSPWTALEAAEIVVIDWRRGF